ncbi:MAG: threonine/serine exporter family protein [Clostridium sp.]
MLLMTFVSFLSAFGFGIIFNIRGKKLLYAAIGGGLSWFFYDLGRILNFTELTSLFFSSICFSIYCEIFARILKTPVTTLVVCALIPLVPGAGMYNTMYAAVTGDAQLALETGITTIASAGTLALGVIFVSTLTRFVIFAKSKRRSKV